MDLRRLIMGRSRKSAAVIAFLVLVTVQTHASEYNVKEYGAKGDKISKDTAAIQAAVNACSKAGGGTVHFPAGDYLSGKIRLLSNVNLHVGAGATIWASREPSDYEGSRALIVAEDAQNISVEGLGTLHGIGEADWGRRPKDRDVRGGATSPENRPSFRAGMIRFSDCRGVVIRGIRVLFSDTWTIHLRDSENVLVDGVTILNNYFRANSDGIDPVSCKNVRISNCHIVAGDDCIVLKTTENGPCENVVVSNCTLESIATAVKIGTETPRDFRNIHFSNCAIRNSTVGIGIYVKDGATVERVTFSNISIENHSASAAASQGRRICPIFVDIEKRHPDSLIGKIRDITFDDIQIYSGVGVLIQGMPESPIENLTLEDVAFRVYDPGDYSNRRKHVGGRRTTSDERDTLYARKPSYVTLAHVKGLTVKDLKVHISEGDFRKYERSAFHGNEMENCVIRNVFREPSGKGGVAPVVALHNCRNTLVTDCIAGPATPVFLGLSGRRTARISIDRTGLQGAVRSVARGKDVPSDAIGD